jgi:hypothetical protein
VIRATVTAQMGGAKRLIKFGTNATDLFCNLYGIGLSEIAEILKTPRPGHYRDLIWSGLVAGVGGEDKADFSRFDVGDWIDEMPQDEFERIWSAFDAPPQGKIGRKS